MRALNLEKSDLGILRLKKAHAERGKGFEWLKPHLN
jgi:hypothetical protein